MPRSVVALPISHTAGMDMISKFFNSVMCFPRSEAIVCENERLTWAQFGANVDAVQKALAAKGIKKGDRVGLLGYNSIRYVEAFLGVLAVGGVVVPLPTMASPASLKMMMTDSKAKGLFVDKGLSHLTKFAAELDLQFRVGLDFDDGYETYESFLKGGEKQELPLVPILPTDEFDIVYSSGTTGSPKGIVHDHAMRTNFVNGMGSFGFAHGDKTLVSTPMYSNTTMCALLPSLAHGATTILMVKNNMDLFLELVVRERITHFMAVPVQYDRLINHPKLKDTDLSSIRLMLCTSAPLRAELKLALIQNVPGCLFEFYGLTEGGIGTTLACTYFQDKLASVGKCDGPNADLQIIDPDTGKLLPPGKTGEIVGYNGSMMKGYEGLPGKVQKMVWKHPETGKIYFRSGDVGRLDKDGFLYLSDRIKDMIISGGFNIYADDLEIELLKNPKVHESAVVAVPSKEWGETPLAYVVLKDGQKDTPEAVRAAANKSLGKHQRISKVIFIDSLPRSDIGKVLKRQLRDKHWPAKAKL